MIGKNVSHHKILEKIGEGGMGVVYKAQDTKLDRIVALKFLPQYLSSDPSEKERFFHEAKAASALNHPNITTIYTIDEFDGQVYIAMEYVEGKTLKKLIETEAIPLKKILDISIQMCDGLAAAREKGVIHRDIKSDNIMVTSKGQVKIMDFGLAKLKGATKLTKAGTTLGTAAYMSPEQASGEEVDHRSDIFSFGVVMYELLTGQLPFKGEHQSAVIYSILNEEPQPVARFNNKVSPEIDRIVFKALAKDKEERYQHIEDLQADLRKERKSLEYVRTGQVTSQVLQAKPKKKLLRILVPASIITIAILLFLILQPFKVEVGTEQKAIAEQNSLAIMYFENIVDREDKERLGEIVTNLLITDLSESQYMNVVSSQRLFDILKLMGKEEVKAIDRDMATQVAQKARARWMLLGSILQLEPEVVLTSQLVEVKSGNVISSQRITGEPKEKIFSIIDKLTVEIRKDLTLPSEAKQEKDPQVADVTTHSPEAYRFYLEGLDYQHKLYTREATESFEKAIKHDSTFAMAYFWLAQMKGELAEKKEMAAKAVKYAGKTSQREQLYIKAMEAALIDGKNEQVVEYLKKLVERYPHEKQAWLGLGINYRNQLNQPQNALQCFRKVIAIDSNDKSAYNLLSYTYDELGNFDSSLWAINKYIELAPEEANPYDSRADLYAYNGRLEQAIESYKKAVEIKPDFYPSVEKLGHMYLFRRDYIQAENYYQKLVSSQEKNTRSFGRSYLALIPIYQGKFNQAMQILDQGQAADRIEKLEGWTEIHKRVLKSTIHVQKNDFNSAIKEAEICMKIGAKLDPNDPVQFKDFYIYLLATSGDVKKAEEVAKSLKEEIEKKDKKKVYSYWFIASLIERVKNNKKAAVDYSEKAVRQLPKADFTVNYFLGQAYLETGRLDEAVVGLEKLLNRYDEERAYNPIWAAKAYYFLAQAYEKSGWKQKAIEKYQEFLDIWKEADPGIPEVADAKQRLAKLKAGA
ncbi:MAG: hypothetical protein RBG1_1C00001G1218 [candidate division Zixibacteria bacterium RBG-1]|nr:MAG: hypothetical protein RBG1_1C00001G1218 [candidate division Zixibacteria bacterium RBG-1]OGC86321.1 MAG: hypothetical protein A2V73_09255 [candidate division Zixibacteria bacterium RBG_19FT_COMBO_42_43]